MKTNLNINGAVILMNIKIHILTVIAVIVFSFSAAALVSAEERFITTTDGVKLYVKTSGRGLPCLFVHGGPGQGSVSFEKMGGDNLEKYLTMIYLDQRGSGKSEISANYSLDRMLKDIEEVRKALGYKRFVILSHSFGGVIAVNYAKKYARRVTHLILANSTLHFYNFELIRERIEYAAGLLKKAVVLNGDLSRDELMKIWTELRQELNDRRLGYKILTENPETIEKMTAIDNAAPRNLDFGRRVLADPQKFSEYYADYTPLTGSIKVPALILTGTTDYAVGSNHYRAFDFPKQTVKTIPGGHLPYYDKTDLFARTINDFVNGH
jgi:proline iminopeptidase